MRAIVGTLLLVGLAAPAGALQIPPRPTSGVSDPAGLLPPEGRRRIEAQLEGYAQGTTARYAVALFPSLEDESTQDFGMRVFEAWKLGGKTTHDGVLIAIYEKERKIRIDVGYGVEDKLPDIVCRHIMDEEMTPRFRAGDRTGGILAALAVIDQRVTGRASAMPVPPIAHQRRNNPNGFTVVVFLVIFIFGIWARVRQARRGGYGGAWPLIFFGGGGGGGGGGDSGGGGWSGGGGGSAGGGGADGGW